jgi:hypothetical protein
MSETTTAARQEPRYPTGDERHYDRRVWPLGEDGDEVMVEGHDRRSLAALSAYMRGEGYTPPSGLARRWVGDFAESCGCTEEQHEKHRDGEDAECYDDCEHIGLPPCGDDYCWVVEWARVDGPPALPVLLGTWR